MKSTLAIAVFALAASNLTVGGEIPQTELSLGGVTIDATEEQVRAQLGKPLASREEADFLNLHLVYSHVTVSFSGDVVAGLASESPNGCTPAGLCPGDSLSRARELYGSPEISDRETGTFWEYYTDCPCWLQVSPQAGKVGALAVACQP